MCFSVYSFQFFVTPSDIVEVTKMLSSNIAEYPVCSKRNKHNSFGIIINGDRQKYIIIIMIILRIYI